MSSSSSTEESRAVCTPCRGTGTLISGQGGTPHPVPCPWCGGDGRFHPGRDAQADRAAQPGRDAQADRAAQPGREAQADGGARAPETH